jgi:hypothetical protein
VANLEAAREQARQAAVDVILQPQWVDWADMTRAAVDAASDVWEAREQRLRALLAEAVGWIESSDCYKHWPRDLMVRMKDAGSAPFDVAADP